MCYVSSLLRGVATGGGEQGIVPPTPPHTHTFPHFNFRIFVYNVRDIAFRGCSEIIRTRNLTIFTVNTTIFGLFMVTFHFF